jgi:acyl-CoA synthetase (AMP-forming)/AMP-acid ligase II
VPGGSSALIQRFETVVQHEPDRVLIHVPATGSGLRARDIWDAHRRYAGLLTAAGVASQQLVLSAAGNQSEAVGLLLAARAIDAAVLAVDAGTTPAEIFQLADRFDAVTLVLPEATSDGGLPHDFRDVDALSRGLRLVQRQSRSHKTYPDGAVLKLTSGSTAAPKATLTTEDQLIADGTHIIAAMGIQPADTQIAAIPVSHSYGLGNLVMPLLLQGTAIVLRESFIPPLISADASRYGARVFPGVPFMFQFFIASPPANGWPAPLSHLISAGALLSADTVRAFHERFGVKIHSFYGASETGGITFDASDVVHRGTVVGRPLPGVTLTLKPDRDLPPGAGRIHVRSAAVARGYSDGTHDGFDADGFLAGDYGAVDAAGQLTLLGRVSSFVNVAGRKVQPEEVEQVLRAMPGVADVRVLAAPDARRGQQIVACIVPQAHTITTLEVRRYCASRLAAFKIPRGVIFLDAIPMTNRGKTDRAALDAIVRARLTE